MTAIFDIHGEDVVNKSTIIDRCCFSCINPRRYVDELPEELWVQIFLRCPVKSVVQVMCVCKYWNLLIKDMGFTRKHLQFQKNTGIDTCDFLFLHDHQIDDAFNYFLFDGEYLANSRESSLPLQSYRNLLHFSRGGIRYSQFKIDGPINGLFCLHNEHGGMIICNLATYEVGFLPYPHQCLPDDDIFGCKRYLYSGVIGFGKDPLDEENYKVILISGCMYADNGYESTYVMLYTTKTNTWRHIDEYVCEVVEPLNNTYLNGLYYWMSEHKCTILVFDMSEKETFRYISTPCRGNLALHNNRIYLFDINEKLNEIDIWVMMEDNNWLKDKNVGGIQGPVVRTLGFWKMENNLLLVIDDSNCRLDTQAILYNTTTREIVNLGPRGYCGGFKVCVYYESLVSLSGEIIKNKGNDGVSLLGMVCDFLLDEPVDYGD